MTSLASRPALRALALVILILVPLAVVALFAGALSEVGSRDGRIPAAIVNQDEMVEQTEEDGTVTPVLAGRLLVTELTGSGTGGGAGAFDWRITNEREAEDALARGDVYAVLLIPEDFSAAVTSLSTEDPTKGQVSLRTDDAHGYLVGPVSEAVGEGLAALFGEQISQQFIAGLVGGTAEVKAALTTAADGATGLETGARGLATALTALRDGASATQQGASSLAGGISQYTSGVGSVSSGLAQLRDATGGLQQLPGAVGNYTSNVTASSQALSAAVAQLDPATTDPAVYAQLQAVSQGLAQLSGAGPALVSGAQGAASAQSGISSIAGAAARLNAASGEISGAAGSLSGGLSQLVTGLDASASGVTTLADGALELSSGLAEGAAQIPDYSEEETQQIAEVGASPIGLTTQRAHEVDDLPLMASSLFIPVSLWIGALATFLALTLFTPRILASTASNLRIARYALVRAGSIVLAQALLLVALLHLGLKIEWSALPATLPFALLIGAVFTCIHAFLTASLGRWGLVLSLMLLALQLTATGGLYPIEIVPEAWQAVSPYLPMTQAVVGMQSILTGVGPAPVIAAAIALAAWGLVAGALTMLAIARKRSAYALGLAHPVPAQVAAIPAARV
ncbi:YhgE/Pip domain-containing protein [Naasia sp. SYSU D00948]|uniref:YhgE/Pip domain-containing protein n=1 Tax=Naasia sp. SYSU D00948 TaxID=2817379 RepID=UPI001B30D2CF|nr:YhgE/Pip family protein [Naasia sp. SYSU D00948]